MEEKICSICGSKMSEEGFDHTGHWKIYRCEHEECNGEVHEATSGDTSGVSMKDLNNIKEYTDSS